MRDRDPPKGFASATMYELIFCRRDPASRMNCKLGSCTAFSYRSLFSVNHSLLLFFARSLKNAKNSGVKYFDFSAIGHDLLSRDIASHRLNIGANGRASKTARTEAIFSPRPRYHARQDDLATRPFDLLSRRIEVVDAHVARAPRNFLRLSRSNSALAAAGRPEREVLTHREFHGLETPAEDLLQEAPSRGGIGARKLGEGHRSVPVRSTRLPCHRLRSRGRAK